MAFASTRLTLDSVAAARVASLSSIAPQGGDRPGLLFVVLKRETPGLGDILAIPGLIRSDRIAIQLSLAAGRLAALANQLDHIDRLRFANDNVVAAGVQRVSGLNLHPPLTLVAGNLQAADHSIPVEKS